MHDLHERMNKSSKILIVGKNGLVGSAIHRRLLADGYVDIISPSSTELDLISQRDTTDFFSTYRPEYVFVAAARVGGIRANIDMPAQFIYDNIMIQSNIIHSSYVFGVKKLLFLGSSCIYPKYAQQPMKESCLLTGELEPTNSPYALAKLSGIKMCQSYNIQYNTSFISAMPTNLYGINDQYNLTRSHVLPALLRKIHEAKIKREGAVVLWGSGKPLREFLYSDDLADACVYLMHEYWDNDIINIGTGVEITINDLALMIKSVVGYVGDIVFDSSQPDGAFRKILDCSKIEKLGWAPRTSLIDGIRLVYDDFLHSTPRA